MSAHLRRRGRHTAPRRQVLAAPAATTLGPAALGLALTAGVIGAPPGSPSSPLELVSHRHVGSPRTPLGLSERIEAFSPYVPQTRCAPTARPGVLAFERLIRATYPDTGTDGIVRACNIGGTSEHKEGRAWDWKVSAYDRHQKAEANALFHWLFATDDEGHRDAMARRLGLMYVVWDRHIWRAYGASEGWQPYHGAEAHTDHAHFSFSWAGALKKTSYWHATGHGRISAAQLRRYAHTFVSRGASGPAVRLIQHALGVRASGVFGTRTQAAVIAFQRAHRLGTDGVVGPRTWRALAGPGSRPARHHAPAAPRSAATPYRRDVAALQHSRRHVLRLTASGPAVEAVQRVLHLRVDGAYGPATRTAVVRWQQRHRLVPDGVVGPSTWRAMIVATQRAESHAVAHARAEAAHARAVAAHARAVAAARHRRTVLASYRHTVLRAGDAGPAVRFVQQRLRLPVDGVYGPRTLRAVLAYQKRHHLTPDGVVGARTWRALA